MYRNYILTLDDGKEWALHWYDILDTINGSYSISDIRVGDNIYCLDNVIRMVIHIEKY